MTVEQILNKFQTELENDALLYVQEAKRLSDYDATLRDTQRDISQLTLMATRAVNDQTSVQRLVEAVAVFQDEMERNLDTVEEQINELFEKQTTQPPIDADVERERAYHRAATIESKLQQLDETLKVTMRELDEKQKRVLPSEVGAMVKTLNQHQVTMADLENRARKVKHEMDQVAAFMDA